MEHEAIEFLSGVLLVSEEPERLASFYRDVLGVPLEVEEHEDTLPHWGCTLGDVHFAIHPVKDFEDRRCGVGAVKLAFNIFDIQALVERLEKKGVELIYPVRDTGYFLTTAVFDPDGNMVEFTQLCDAWFEDLESRQAEGGDVVARWRLRRQKR
jgi:predicted enzyme related to lactoylglutathione lyase